MLMWCTPACGFEGQPRWVRRRATRRDRRVARRRTPLAHAEERECSAPSLRHSGPTPSASSP